MPPRTLKSHYASIALPAYALAVRPELKILCVAGHRGLADDHHTATLDVMSHPKYRALFPHVKFTHSAHRITLPNGGSRSSFTPTTALAGRGADLIIIDDPQRPDEAEDSNKTGLITRWFDRNIYQRFNDKADSTVILVMQRLAKDDLTDHLLTRGGWEHISLSAIATEEERYPRLFGDRPIRNKGDALNPEREDLAQHRAALMEIGARAFMAQYMQDPYPIGEGDIRCGAFHLAPHPDATDKECVYAQSFFGKIPEEEFVLDRIFGERTCIRQGPPPPMSTEEWEEIFRGGVHRAIAL